MGMMKRLFEELQELGYTQKEIENQKYLADGWTLVKLAARYNKSIRKMYGNKRNRPRNITRDDVGMLSEGPQRL